MNDPFTSQPEFQIAVTGGTVVENNQLATAIYHALQVCGFSAIVADPMTTLTPGPVQSHDVLNALFALNPDLFETPITLAGITEQEANNSQAMMLRHQSMLQHQMGTGMPSGNPNW